MKPASSCLSTLFLSAVVAPIALVQAAPVRNASTAEVSAALQSAALRHRIPSTVLFSLAWQESGWRQRDEKGQAVASDTDHVGLLGVPTQGRTDKERLQSDWCYNIDEGAKALAFCWNRASMMTTTTLDDTRNILEAWYFALGRYGKPGAAPGVQNTFAESVFTTAYSSHSGRWTPTVISRPNPQQLAESKNLLCPPVPWHFGDVAPLPPSRAVVSLTVPYLNQVYDAPTGFRRGEGACGPTSMLMALAFFGKITPKPELVPGRYDKPSLYAAYLPEIYGKVCEPGLGAVHAKMLDYFRPQFPGVAIFYNEKATPDLVKRELDAGRPCILGTQVTSAGHIMVARGYLADGRFLVNDPAGDRERPAIAPGAGPLAGYSKTGVRYWNGDGDKAVYEWDVLQVRWVMTLGPSAPAGSDKAEDAK